MQTMNDSDWLEGIYAVVDWLYFHNYDWLEGIYAVVDWLYFHMWKQLYAILIGCISVSHM